MCGINALIGRLNPADAAEAMNKMNAALRHRGPEGSGMWQHEGIIMGHTALKISDHSGTAAQPMFSRDKQCVLIYNGELYNTAELMYRPELARTEFTGKSDTEVLLHLLCTMGRNALPLLNGMFAFVFADLHRNEIIVARDRHGIKPLFFREQAGLVSVSSEIKGLLAGPGPAPEPDYLQIPHYLLNRTARSPETFYKGIYELMPGTCMVFRSVFAAYTGGAVSNERDILNFCEQKPLVKEISPGELLRKTEELLVQSVSRQMKADVPVGLLLSGGVDSTLIASLISEAGYKNVPAFSVINSAAQKSFGSNDFMYAEKAALQYGLKPNLLTVDSSALNRLPEFVSNLGQPIADGAGLLTKLISEVAKPRVTVLLSGAGADELFAGYNRHKAFYNYIRFRHFLPVNLMQAWAPILPVGFAHPLRKHFRLLSRFAGSLHSEPTVTFRNFTRLNGYPAGFFRKSVPGDLSAENMKGNESLLRFALETDMTKYLRDDILAITDLASMAQSVEVRVPFLDNDLSNLLTQVPANLLFRGGRKWALRQMLVKRKGEIYVKRRKEGFGMPTGEWLREPAFRHLTENLYKTDWPLNDYVNRDVLKTMVQTHSARRADYAQELWAMIVLQEWFRQQG
ncbi:MAG: asparagine synthase (glutamine-hydrolyzing) [Bacteroidota bacterium]